MSHNQRPHSDGWDLPEVVSSARDPRTAPIPAPEAGLESYYAPGDEPVQKGVAPSPHGTAATTATGTTGKEVYTGTPPLSDMQASKYTAEGQTEGLASEAEGERTPFWTRRKIWIAVVVGVVIVVAVVVGAVVGTQVGGKDSSDDQNSSTTSTSDDNSPTSTVNTAFGTPTSFPSSLTGSDSACSGAICGATLSLATPVGSSNSADNLLLFALGTDGSFLYREADATGWKGNWSSLGGDFESPPAVVASSSGRLDIFGVTRSDLIMQYKTFRAGSWDSRWTSLGGDCYAPPALCGFPDGTIYVVTSSDARQTGIKKFSEGTWDRPGTANWNTHNTGYMASNPATACTRGKQAHVLAFGADERGAGPPYELMIKRDNGTRMDFWRTAGGSFQGEPVTFVEDADADVFTVFGLGADDAELDHGTFSRENATTVDGGGSPKRVGGPEFMSVPSVVRNPKGDIDILAVDRNGKLRRAAFDREATLSVDDWQDLGGFFSSAPAARLTANDTVSVFGMGPEGSIIHGRWTVDDDGKWTEGEWFDDGGDFSSRWYSPGPA